jgi:hypothetical protein
LFGGWQTTFTIGYGVPLKDFVFTSDGKRFLNITFGSPMEEILIEKLIVKVCYEHAKSNIVFFYLFVFNALIYKLLFQNLNPTRHYCLASFKKIYYLFCLYCLS